MLLKLNCIMNSLKKYPGLVIIESEDPCSSIIKYITNNNESYIGLCYNNDENKTILKLCETISGLSPGWFSKEINLENFCSLPFIKRLKFFKFKLDERLFNDLYNEFNINNDVNESHVYENIFKYVFNIKGENLNSGYYNINNIIAKFMQVKCNNFLSLMNNSIFEKGIVIVNENYFYNEKMQFPRLNIISKTFLDLYTKNYIFKINFEKRINYKKEPNNKNISYIIDKLYNIINDIHLSMFKQENVFINITEITDLYNSLVEETKTGITINNYSNNISNTGIVYCRDFINNLENFENENISIYNNKKEEIKIKSKLDGNIIIPLFNSDLNFLSSKDLLNILEMVNSLNNSDTRFSNIQNKILDILSSRENSNKNKCYLKK